MCFSCPLSAIPCSYIRVFHQRQACNCGKNCKSIHFARFSDCAAIVTGACQGIGKKILSALRRKKEKVCSNEYYVLNGTDLYSLIVCFGDIANHAVSRHVKIP